MSDQNVKEKKLSKKLIADLVYENAGLKAERDAALAAIERVRDALALGEELDKSEGEHLYPRGRRLQVANRVLNRIGRALDGAPEPEWEWAVRAPGDDEPFSDVYQSREHLAEQETGIAWGEEQLVRRRKAGPWLPVEGESK